MAVIKDTQWKNQISAVLRLLKHWKGKVEGSGNSVVEGFSSEPERYVFDHDDTGGLDLEDVDEAALFDNIEKKR